MKPAVLLSRDNFREGVFKRDNYKCIFCDETRELFAHHIIERRAWVCGGYYLENGATVCERHHLECEMTLISVEKVREACGITRIVLPEHFYESETYDKWGNLILQNGMRLRGELFQDESVQKILRMGGVLDSFTWQVKYPRTYHLPWSEGMHDDDRMLKSLEHFIGREVVVTKKQDGENTSMYSDYFHARSIDGRSHPSRDWVKNFWAKIKNDIPTGWRICGENMYAQHSIVYHDLLSYFYGFSIWNERNRCIGWDDTLEYFEILGITPVEEIYRGVFDEKLIKELYDSKRDWATCEGYVVRLADDFDYRDFRNSVAKFVRKGHVQTTKHWMHGRRIEANGLIKR
ncbi:RNA ligase family protein [Pseudomonas putida]|uniref:RNA ligase family protein n=1 Tax=Pseudomonas putida TaxID=303 RepID=UPI001E64582F|nr:RNA ligase family protein [Pseudomonas putida]